MDEIQTKPGSLKFETSSFNTIDVGAKKQQAKAANMFQGKNIHSSPLDGKLLCSYSEKLCKQRRLNGYAFCIRHVLEDKNAPFKQCQFVAKYNGHQCTNPIPFAEDRIYCNSHLQVLGIVPKKIRRKKPGDGVENGVNSSSTTSESKARTDVLLTTPASTNMPSIPPQLFPFRLKKPRNQPHKRAYTNIPAIEELRESRKKWQKDRTDLFKIYDIESSDDDSSSERDEIPWQQIWLSADSDLDYDALRRENNCLEADIRTAKISRLSTQLRRQLHQLRRTLRTRHRRYKDLLASGSVLVKAVHSNSSACVDSLLESSKNSRRTRPRPAKCLAKTCAFSQDDVQCNKKAFPYTKFCKDRIFLATGIGLDWEKSLRARDISANTVA
ncbi:INO80 complex subunit D [Desmophyllum pertusum]|uniref:INO80 complex subunit D n=1 Tax=Desmophyllum pertusum TaxID=174260 RepID=A0A9W9ZZ45_9CNID|nr:INO80 complex subunit D [Desmophyllum pertusum]